jgi:hypothetical protein
MATLRARAETAEKCADAAEADRRVAEARADHAAAEQEEANRRADALKVLLDATHIELAALRNLVAAAPHDAEKLQHASEVGNMGPRRVGSGGAERLAANGKVGSIGSARASGAVRSGAATATTLGRRTG